MRITGIRPVLLLAVVLVIGTLVAAPTGASATWRAIPGGIGPTVAMPPPLTGGAAGPHATPAGCYAGRCEYLASMYVEGTVATGATATLNQARPKVVPHERSIAGIVVASADGHQSVLFGWMVSKTAFGDTVPHIVISSVVNGAPQCINGCGFVPVVKSPPKVAVGRTGKFTIKRSKARWLLVYNNKTLGYYRTSHWPGNKLAAITPGRRLRGGRIAIAHDTAQRHGQRSARD